MASPIADGVMAATHRLVQQAMSGQWQEVPKTVEERQVLLQRLSAGATPKDREWLSALQQAIAESDAAVARMAAASGSAQTVSTVPSSAAPDSAGSSHVDLMMDMISKSRPQGS